MNTRYSSLNPVSLGSISFFGSIVILGFALSCAPNNASADSPASTEKKSEQSGQNKKPEIHIILLENGYYDIDGVPATEKTFEQVLKADLGEYPKDYRRLFISGTPKNQRQVDLALTTADRLKAAITVKWDNPGIHFETSANTYADTGSPADAFRKAAQQKKEGTPTPSDNRPVISGPATDPRVIINGFQDTFKPAGAALTEEQQKKITEAFDPAKPDDLRQIFGVFTRKQKQILINRDRAVLEKSPCPLTKSQESRIMALGPGGKDKSVIAIYTPEQLKILFEAAISSKQKPAIKKSE